MPDVHTFLRELGQSLSIFLQVELSQLSTSEWWRRYVLAVLTPAQVDNVKRRGLIKLDELDLAALLRVLDQNWFEISSRLDIPREVRNYIKEMTSIRNRWAHAGMQSPPNEDIYRDLDTIQRLVQALGDSDLANRLANAKRELMFGGGTSSAIQKAKPDRADSDKSNQANFEPATNQRIAEEVDSSPAAIDEKEPSQVDLVLIGCVKTKREGRHPAKDLFISPLFIGRRARAEALHAPWFILSAKFGLLPPDREVDTYDVSLNNTGTAERRAWSKRVLESLKEQYGSVAGKTIEVHAGASYYKFGLVQGLKAQGAHVVIPLKHALLGEQLAWYNAQAMKGPNEVQAVPRNKASEPSRSPLSNLQTSAIKPKNQPISPTQVTDTRTEILSTQEIPPFSYRWPENLEQFSRGWQMQVRHGGHVHHVRYGIGGRVCFGRYRVHTVLWLDGKPMVEGAEAEDYPTTGDLVSVLKVHGGNRDARSLEEVDPAYSSLRVERHCDAIDGPNARRGLAVRIGQDDLHTWVRHALLRARSKGMAISSLPVVPEPKIIAPAGEVTASSRQRVTASLLEFDRQLAAGLNKSFTPNPEADTFVRNDAFAFLVAVICDEQVRFEAAWEAPLKLKQRLGHWDIHRIAGERDRVRAAFATKPALHRWVSITANRVVEAAGRVISRYRGDTSLIWSDEPSAAELRERFELFEGIGQKKSSMAVEILARVLRVPLRHLAGSDVAVDVHVRRVFLRSGLAERDDIRHIILVARNAHPDRPGALDYPAWEIGRVWCRPTNPKCSECPIGAVCPKLIDRASSVRGA